VVTAGLAGCDLGQPHSFDARAEKSCATATRGITAEVPVKDPVGFAVDRFAQIDRVLVVVSTDTGFPGGTTGAHLRTAWIHPARASLEAGRPSLDTLRQVAGSATALRARVFAVVARAGDGGVRIPVLRQLGLTACATLFDLPVPPVVS
jgi:hypothetical protein